MMLFTGREEPEVAERRSTVHPWFGMGPMPAGAIRVMTRAIMEGLKEAEKK
jgi:hypothetical protein